MFFYLVIGEGFHVLKQKKKGRKKKLLQEKAYERQSH